MPTGKAKHAQKGHCFIAPDDGGPPISPLVLYTENDFRQLVVAIETTPAFLGGLGELEDHGERCLV